MNERSEFHPGTTPEDETVLAEAPSFIRACLQHVDKDIEDFDIRFWNSILTRKKDWGLVWRVDVTFHNRPNTPGLIKRFVFWQPLDHDGDNDIGFALLWAEQPLPASD